MSPNWLDAPVVLTIEAEPATLPVFVQVASMRTSLFSRQLP
jgi:hypothetical protein